MNTIHNMTMTEGEKIKVDYCLTQLDTLDGQQFDFLMSVDRHRPLSETQRLLVNDLYMQLRKKQPQQTSSEVALIIENFRNNQETFLQEVV